MATDVGVLAHDFWHMTPAYLHELAAVYRRKQEQEQERAAWIVSHLLAAWCEKPPSIDRLMGRETEE